MTAAIQPRNLRTELQAQPMVIDIPQPRFSWELVADAANQVQAAYQILVADDPAVLADAQGNMWDSGKVTSGQCNHIVYNGQPLESVKAYWWCVRVWDGGGTASNYSEAASWQMGLLDSAEWQANWIGLPVDPTHDETMPPPVYLRRAFEVNDPVRKATIFTTARGCYVPSINGQRVGPDVLNPGWTDYNIRIEYQAYDVTALLTAGENVIAAIVGDGWYAGYVGMNYTRARYGSMPQYLLQLHIEYESGEQTILVTDESWQASTGPIRYSDLQMGEYYDARLAMPGWDAPGFAPAGWQPAQVQARDETLLVAQVEQPIRVTREITPVSIAQPEPGVYIFDMGQNMVGWVRLTVQGEAGQEIQLRHSEVLLPDGTLYTDNLRDARQIDTVILSGQGQEVYEPSFTFHGFRYVEVTGLTQAPTPTMITGCVVHNDMPETGSFTCGEPMINQLWQNILWGQRGNFISVPTDCPQRNERLGWTGDAQVFIRTASFNMDVAAFFTKWMTDVVDAQSEAGGFPNFAPRIVMVMDVDARENLDGAPAWGDAGVIIPWTLYRVYGDTRVIEQNYAAMQRWMTYIAEVNPDYLRINRCSYNFADWLSLGPQTPVTLVATAYWFYCAQLMQEMAAAIGRGTDAQAYQTLCENIRAAFIAEYVAEDGRVAGDTQTGYVLALHFGLLPEALHPAAVDYLVRTIARDDWHIATGFLGTPLLCPVLTEIGLPETAYRLLLNDTYPSWGYMIKQGATTMWERWDGWTDEHGFQNPDMNSFNHYAYGAIGEWLYRYIAGIDLDTAQPDYAGYKRIRIRPYPNHRLQFARASFHSMYGEIRSHWRLEDGQLHLQVSIPANTTARIIVPAKNVRQVSGAAASETVEETQTIFTVGSGAYHFTGSWEQASQQ